MIISRLQGGHSNQLFQYAIGRKLAKKLNTELFLDLSWFRDFADVDTPRFYELDCYPLKAKTLEMFDGIRIVDPRQPVSGRDKLLRKLHLGNAVWMFYEEHQGFNPKVLEVPDNTLLIGYWQNEKYFADIRDELITELEPTTKLSSTNAQLLKKIKTVDAVSIHVRRGDYVTNKNAAAFHGLLDMAYYQKGIDYIKKTTGSKKLEAFVFSNDIAWCKKNLRLNVPVTFVEGNDKGSDDMRLMKQCRHFIMANSSFSWWGAWLGQAEDKIVIAPKQWFKDKRSNSEIDIVLDSWIRL